MGVFAEESDIRAIFRVNKQRDPIRKIIFKDLETRLKYSSARRKLSVNKDLWIRGDLTKPKEHLAWMTRKAYERTSYHSWTSLGTILMAKGPTSKLIKINSTNRHSE